MEIKELLHAVRRALRNRSMETFELSNPSDMIETVLNTDETMIKLKRIIQEKDSPKEKVTEIIPFRQQSETLIGHIPMINSEKLE